MSVAADVCSDIACYAVVAVGSLHCVISGDVVVLHARPLSAMNYACDEGM